MSEELKPCPICGGPSDVICAHGQHYWVQCAAKSACVGNDTGILCPSKAEAVSKWNRRVPDAAAIEAAYREGYAQGWRATYANQADSAWTNSNAKRALGGGKEGGE